MYNQFGQEMIVPEDDPVTGGQIMIVPEDEDMDDIFDEDDMSGLGAFNWRKAARFSPAAAATFALRKGRSRARAVNLRQRAITFQAQQAMQRMEKLQATINRQALMIVQLQAQIKRGATVRPGVRPYRPWDRIRPIRPGQGFFPWGRRTHWYDKRIAPTAPQADAAQPTVVQTDPVVTVPEKPLTKPEVVKAAATIAERLAKLRAAGMSPSRLHVAELNMRAQVFAEAKKKRMAAANAKSSDMQGIF
jgi:hypothetical protein